MKIHRWGYFFPGHGVYIHFRFWITIIITIMHRLQALYMLLSLSSASYCSCSEPRTAFHLAVLRYASFWWAWVVPCGYNKVKQLLNSYLTQLNPVIHFIIVHLLDLLRHCPVLHCPPLKYPGALKMEDQKMQDIKIKDLLRLRRAFVVTCEQTCTDMEDNNYCWACDTME